MFIKTRNKAPKKNIRVNSSASLQVMAKRGLAPLASIGIPHSRGSICARRDDPLAS